MIRSFGVGLALAFAAMCIVSLAHAARAERTLPMHFELRQEGPADACKQACRTLIAASGAITADTPQDFMRFIGQRSLRGATMVLDSDGGSVLGAIAFGREVRRLNLSTMVGRLVDLASTNTGDRRARIAPRADCESMCTFVLLAGVTRSVPQEARVMVHQIWLGDRREDPTAANYSAEDLVLVQRDIGRLARYNADMGGPAELLELALRIPPWEPMHALTRDELKRMKLDNGNDTAPAVVASASPSLPVIVASAGPRVPVPTEQSWTLVGRNGSSSVLARRHPLTVEGEEIGTFDLTLACNAGGDGLQISYAERRNAHGGKGVEPLEHISISVGGDVAPLKIVSSERRTRPDVLDTFASTDLPAELVHSFAIDGPRSMTIETESKLGKTVIRLGNTGVSRSLPALRAGCQKQPASRAELPMAKTGGTAAVR
jgi:hypothetical protein